MVEPETEEFRVGDLVRLKTGGRTALTVFAIGMDLQGHRRLWCCWHDETGERKGSFAPGALELVCLFDRSDDQSGCSD
ncbi:DUF2158 domain-containing protein [Flaviflagellibacter deserti]|uniref:DUF2158 domain-containing protein n=1 Tax=Flaviflagellibacter deserti TaxID=2267266 RepID=A0ABV9YZS0_9HYPH